MAQNLRIGAAYIRVSTDDQAELSPDAQLRVILDEAKKRRLYYSSGVYFRRKKRHFRKKGRKPAGIPEDDRRRKIPEPGSL